MILETNCLSLASPDTQQQIQITETRAALPVGVMRHDNEMGALAAV
jgi:hypothetical protein